MCDSIAESLIPERCIEDTVSFLRYYYPEIQETHGDMIPYKKVTDFKTLT